VSRAALLAGATGLVGGHVVEQLLADDTWSTVVSVGRRATPHRHAKLEQRIMDLGALEAQGDLPHVDDVFCCLGTTIKQAGSQAAFRRVDHDFVLSLANAGLRLGATQFLLVSAIGADPESRMFYNRVKGDVEAALRRLPYRALQIFRPGLLLGDRAEFRFGERIAMLAVPLVHPLLIGRLRRYHSIHARDVARAMVRIAREAPRGPNVWEYDGMRANLTP
jgi:uncharacterized protein YbjT (DUF2867 family)